MKNKVLDQRGVAPVLEIILVVVLVGVLGIVGYRAYQARQATPAETSQTEANNEEKVVDPYAGWETYTSPTEQASFKYPPRWKLNASADGAVTLTSDTSQNGRNFILSWKTNDSLRGSGNTCTVRSVTNLVVPGYGDLNLFRCDVDNGSDRVHYTHVTEKMISAGDKTDSRQYSSKKNLGKFVSLTGGYLGEGGPLGFSLDAFNNLDEVKIADLIYRSLKY